MPTARFSRALPAAATLAAGAAAPADRAGAHPLAVTNREHGRGVRAGRGSRPAFNGTRPPP